MRNLWAPWRLEYVENSASQRGCFLCNAWNNPGHEEEHLLLQRGEKAFVIVNRYPYSNGHVMVSPVRHIGGMAAVDAAEAAEMWRLTVLCQEVLAEHFQAQGFNVGINLGACAGAGVRDHIHIHVVPRWEGDTNFMPVLSETKVIPQGLTEIYRRLRPGFAGRDA